MKRSEPLTEDLFGPIPGAQLALFASEPSPIDRSIMGDEMADRFAAIAPAVPAEKLRYPDSIGPAIDRYNAEQRKIRKQRKVGQPCVTE